MSINWYFGRDEFKNGPYTAKQMQGLASSGELRPTDTVWKEGVERGVVATRVEYLFTSTPAPQPPITVRAVVSVPVPAPAVPSSPPPSTTKPLSPADSLPEDARLAPLDEAPALETPAASPDHNVEEAPAKKPPPKHEVRKRRMVSIKGGILVSQDGVNLRFRKTCVKCHHQDTSVASMQIPLGNSRISFFCPRCRKNQPVEIQGAC